MVTRILRFPSPDRNRHSAWRKGQSAVRGDKDAERMSGNICEDEQRFVRVVGTIQQLAGAEAERPLPLLEQGFDRRHGGVQMQHLRAWTLGPCRLRKIRHLLE